jgi:hypothetical protein
VWKSEHQPAVDDGTGSDESQRERHECNRVWVVVGPDDGCWSDDHE